MRLLIVVVVAANIWMWALAIYRIQQLQRWHVNLTEGVGKLGQSVERLALAMRDLVVAAQREQGKWN